MGNLEGVITDDKSEPIVGATIQLLGSYNGTVSNSNGKFILDGLPLGQTDVEIRSIGFKPTRLSTNITEGSFLNVQLEKSTLTMGEVVVTGTMQPTFISNSPVKVDVVTSDYIDTYLPSAATSIVEGISFVNGVQEVVACGVCFTNSLSINGLPGPYTTVLMDGAPIYGNLASVYGLNGIPSMIIDRFEVIKGPSSTLYGSEAVAGVINIITKRPSEQPFVSLDIMGTTNLESFGNISMAPRIGKSNGFVGINYGYIKNFTDNNNDDFGDMINLDRISLFTKWEIHRKSGLKFNIAGKYYYEDRRNGVKDFMTDRNYRSLRGSDEIYGESIYTERFEIFGTYQFSSNLKLDFSTNSHSQNSYYGSDFYKADQQIFFSNLIFDKSISNHLLMTGLTSRLQYYDDNTVATYNLNTDSYTSQFIPGIFIQDEWNKNQFTILAGARFDHYREHGYIFSPRLSTKYQIGDWTTIRSNFGTGFRIVNLFTEDHAAITGQRTVVINENLRPEESINMSFNLSHLYSVRPGQGMIDIDVFYTHFKNKITPDYETNKNQILYSNVDGHAVSKGIGIALQHEFLFPISINAGLNRQKVVEVENSQSRDIEFAPFWTGVVTANYKIEKWNTIIAYSANWVGPMALPSVYDLDENGEKFDTPRPIQSKSYSLHNIKWSINTKPGLMVYFGIQNLFNWVQPFSPIAGTNDPNTNLGFSENFDTAYAYAPIHGRELFAGFKWDLKR